MRIGPAGAEAHFSGGQTRNRAQGVRPAPSIRTEHDLRQVQPRGADRRGHRADRAQRRRQVDAAPLPGRRRPAGRGHHRGLRQPDVGDQPAGPPGRGDGDRRPRLLPRPVRGRAPGPAGSGARHHRPRRAGRRGARGGAAGAAVGPAARHPVVRPASPARARHRVRPSPQAADPRRAGAAPRRRGRRLAVAPAPGGAPAGPRHRLRQPRADAGRERRDPRRDARGTTRMSAAEVPEAGGLEPPEPPQTPVLTPATPRELRGLMKDWRRGRATRNLGQALSDAYVAVIAALMIGAMTVNVILKAQRVVASCSTASCLSARALLPWAAVLAGVATALAVARLFWPVLASAAEGFWLLDAPISRSRLLRSRLVAALAGAFVGGGLIGGLVALLTGSGLLESAVWAVATGLSASAAVAAAAAQQGHEHHRLSRAASFVFGLLGVVALLGVVGVAAGWFTFRLSATVGTEIGTM